MSPSAALGILPMASRPRAPARSPLWRQDQIMRNTSPADLWETRMAFEPQLTRLAALHATPRELEHIAELHAASQPTVYDRSIDVALHRAIARASHNALGAFLVDRIAGITLDPSFVGRTPPLTDETGYDHHDALVSALMARDAARAERMMMTHLRAITLWASGLAQGGEIR
ncbi:MAG: FadR family transcriptional regulator [Rhodobacter sp.]|nr:FadR family transcriptional regulator [Paracoccaceae bacterium]MCC0077038.1 FadR family transcriptional regulator [Rhodobacter sp.]